MVPSDVPSADRVAIGQAATAFVDAWNAHDSHAFALTFVPDGDFTNVLGVHVRGRPGIDTLHARVFETIFKTTHQTLQVRSARPELRGLRELSGPEYARGIHASRAKRGHTGRGQRHPREHRCGANEDAGVMRADAEEETLQHACQDPSRT
jgi:hypothetical protein